MSGGDALVRVEAPRGLLGKLAVLRNGTDVTEALHRDGDALLGLVEGLQNGENTLAVRHNRRSSAPPAERLTVVNHPITGPVATAIARGLYGAWTPTAGERARLEQIFPTGVCDYTQPDQGRPGG